MSLRNFEFFPIFPDFLRFKVLSCSVTCKTKFTKFFVWNIKFRFTCCKWYFNWKFEKFKNITLTILVCKTFLKRLKNQSKLDKTRKLWCLYLCYFFRASPKNSFLRGRLDTKLCSFTIVIFPIFPNFSRSQVLTHSWQRSLSYRNQSIDFQSKSMDWFLYDRDLRHERVNSFGNSWGNSYTKVFYIRYQILFPEATVRRCS